MKTIKSKNEVNGLLVKDNKKKLLDNLIGDILKDIPGVIDYKIYIETSYKIDVKTNIVLIFKKEYELINVLDGNMQELENKFNEQFINLFHSQVEIILLYK